VAEHSVGVKVSLDVGVDVNLYAGVGWVSQHMRALCVDIMA